MKLALIIFLIFFISNFLKAQKPLKKEMPFDTTIIKIKTQKKKNIHITLFDTSRLKEDFIAYSPIRKFVTTYSDSTYSFVSIIDIDVIQNKLIIRNDSLVSKLDSICFDFCKNYILYYKWKIEPARDRRHRIIIGFTFLFDNETKTLTIEMDGIRGKLFSQLLSFEIPFFAFSL